MNEKYTFDRFVIGASSTAAGQALSVLVIVRTYEPPREHALIKVRMEVFRRSPRS